MEREVREVLEAAWETLCQSDKPFRRWACQTIDERGTTNAGKFARFLDAEAYTDAALMLVPDGWRFRLMSSDFEGFLAEVWNDGADDCEFADRGPIPALAIAQAALKTKETDHAPE